MFFLYPVPYVEPRRNHDPSGKKVKKKDERYSVDWTGRTDGRTDSVDWTAGRKAKGVDRPDRDRRSGGGEGTIGLAVGAGVEIVAVVAVQAVAEMVVNGATGVSGDNGRGPSLGGLVHDFNLR
jgi:hypothetical protein